MYAYLKVSLLNIDETEYPVWVLLHFVDAQKNTILLKEKKDILTEKEICKSELPISGFFVKCEILQENGEIVLIDISKPFGMVATDGKTVFSVDGEMLSNKHFDDSI